MGEKIRELKGREREDELDVYWKKGTG